MAFDISPSAFCLQPLTFFLLPTAALQHHRTAIRSELLFRIPRYLNKALIEKIEETPVKVILAIHTGSRYYPHYSEVREHESRGEGNVVVSQPVIFSDLDGTLLDPKTYSFSAALPAIGLIKERGIPLVFCSSKTRAEIEIWRKRLGNHHPFIAENGGGIFVPLSYFAEEDVRSVWPKTETIEGYFVLILGTPYPVLRRALEDLRRDGFDARGFGDMSVPEVTEVTGLSGEEAELAKRREFDETFIFHGGKERIEALLRSIGERGLRCVQGRFYHLTGENDKGRAVEMLKGLYRRKLSDITTIALGDSPVDFPMLEKVDYPVLVRNYRGEHDQGISLPNLIKAEGIGPEGWNRSLLILIRGGAQSIEGPTKLP